MAETKYGKHIIRDPLGKLDFPQIATPIVKFDGEQATGEPTLSFGLTCVFEPFLMRPDPHSHDFHQFLCFFGGNPMNFKDFGGQVEICLGEEQEKHVINSPTIVHVPPGLLHCPLNFKKIDKPIMYMDAFLSPSYSYIKKD